jgi:hypothetical protein
MSGFSTAADARRFILGGNATFTVTSTVTGTSFTYKVMRSQPGGRGVFFVSLLTGPDNVSDYSYLGIIPVDDPQSFRLTAKSKAGEGATSVKAFRWLWAQLNASRLPASVQVRHEGSCGRCGRALTVPASIDAGFGPECINYV